MKPFVSLALAVVCAATPSYAQEWTVSIDSSGDKLTVTARGSDAPAVTQIAQQGFRPFLHPVANASGTAEITQYSPGHHPHQTGIYWGFTRVNGRDYFHHPEATHWKRQSLRDLSDADGARWATTYAMLDEDGEAVMTERQEWAIDSEGSKVFLDLVWTGTAHTEVRIGEYDYGGLFIRAPWEPGTPAEVANTARQRDGAAEGKRAMWLDLGIQLDGAEDLSHIAVFDHPGNRNFPQSWRVDGQFGVGPAATRLGDIVLEEGEELVYRHRLVLYEGERNDLELTDAWKAYSGQGGTWALWGLAQREGREAEFLTPERAVESMTLQEGFDMNVFAAEPMITQPMAFCWDHKGRLWIAENRDYESRGGGFSGSGDSRILILEDTDRDGVADKRTVFMEGLAFPAAIAVGFDGLFLGAPPHLLFVPDRDGDDKADMDDIEVRLTGWGIQDRHETLNSFRWGPDGWLYGCQGFATYSKVRKPSGSERLYRHNDPFPEDLYTDEGVEINGGVFRYHPTKDIFEVVAHGFSNPWGLDFDAKGNIFITACVIPHLWHVIPGGIYHRQGGRHFNPYVYSDIRTIATHRHRSAHGGARVYQSDAFPDRYQGSIFMANIHEHAILVDEVEPSGSGFKGRHGEDFALANNAQWVGFSMEIGPEGAVYALDWHDGDICGKEILNKDTGRVFRVQAKESLAEDWPGRYDDLATMSTADLVALQSSPSAWHANRARLALQERAETGELDRDDMAPLHALLNNVQEPVERRLRALWGLYVSGALDEIDLIGRVGDRDPNIRAWAIRLLAEPGKWSQTSLAWIDALAGADPSPVVRLAIASALQRMPHENRWPIANNLLNRAEDADDHNIPKMIWFAVEPLVGEDPEMAMGHLAKQAQIPMVREFIARRAVDGGHLDTVVNALAQGASAAILVDWLRGALAGLEGKADIETPEQWPSVFARLSTHSSSSVQDLAVALGQRLGDSRATEAMIAMVDDSSADADTRGRALRALAKQREPAIRELLLNEIGGGSLQLAAIRAVADYEDLELAEALIGQLASLDASARQEATLSLSSRPAFGRALTEALAAGEVEKAWIPAYAARQLERVLGPSFLEVWGPVSAADASEAAAFDKYGSLLTDDALAGADLEKGQALFSAVCAACHKLHGEGGEVGPDITGANRSDLDYLLSNILDPSGVIQDDYKMQLITTRDGRTYAGNVTNETERELTLRIVGQEVRVPKSEIQDRETTPYSMMPEGLLATLSNEQVIDLVRYLQSDPE